MKYIKLHKSKMQIIRNYKIGSFTCVDVLYKSLIYTRETYTGIYYTWYYNENELSRVNIPLEEMTLEKEYKLLKNEGKRKEKLKRILNDN